MSFITPSEIDQGFGSFFGSTLDRMSCEVLAIAKIDRKILEQEQRLYTLKWFDYRQLHPTMATYLMTHYYNGAYGDYIGKNLNQKLRFTQAFKGKNFLASREVKSFWKLRQKIDELGIRYEFFLRKAMDWYATNGWKRPPRPAHISSNDELIIDVCNAWQRELRAKIQWASSKRFMTCNFVGAADQQAYEKFLMQQIMERPHPKFSIKTALYQYDALRIEAALTFLPVEAVIEAIKMSLN